MCGLNNNNNLFQVEKESCLVFHPPTLNTGFIFITFWETTGDRSGFKSVLSLCGWKRGRGFTAGWMAELL